MKSFHIVTFRTAFLASDHRVVLAYQPLSLVSPLTVSRALLLQIVF